MKAKTYKPKPKRCKVCQEFFTPVRPLQQVCSAQCGYKYANKTTEKNLRRTNKAKLRDLMTLEDHKKELQYYINQIVKYIDMKVPCVATGEPLHLKRNSGHFRGTKAYPAIRFNLINIHSQTIQSNQHNGGMPLEYLEGIIKMYGQDYADEMFALNLNYPVLKIAIPDVIEAKAKAAKILKNLKKEEKTYSVQERIEMRRRFNEEIGIYK